MIKKGIIALTVLTLLVTLSACKNPKTASEASATSSSSTVEATLPQEGTSMAENTNENTSDNTSENTGNDMDKPVSDFVFPVKGERPYAVMIDNEGSRPLPQGGLYMAQVIYEAVAEGGVTRLMPVFWGVEPTLIGPVRSSRHYFLDYAMEHDAIYVHFGYSPQALHDIKAFKINNVNGVANGGEVFWDLTKDRKNWQDSYTSMEKVKGYVKKVKYRTTTEKEPVFAYNTQDVELVGGSNALNIKIRYSSDYSCGYTYDAGSKTYLRFRQGKPQMERTTGQQLSAKNIIIQRVRNHSIKGDDKDRQEVYDVGSGNGWYITCGKVIKMNWSKESRTSPTIYTDESGNRIMLNPGQTWVQVVPVSGNITIE